MSSLPISPNSLVRLFRSREARLPRWVREPLVHFILLGGVLFGADRVINGSADERATIVVGAEVDAEAKRTFKAARGREPIAEELASLRRIWRDNEALYRDGLALQVDRGDSAIRDRVIFKALSIVDSNLKLPPVDDKALRAWFESRRDKYDEPARFDFQEAVLAGENGESAVRAFVAALNAGNPGDAKAGLRVFKGRPHANIVQSYGEEFAAALESGTGGEWRALRSRDGWRAVQLGVVTPAKPASYEALRGVVLQDWTDATMAELRTAAVRSMAKKYTIRHEEPK